MVMPTPTKNKFTNWFQDYRACARDAIGEVITAKLIKELSPDPREEFLEMALEDIMGALPFGEEALKIRKYLLIAAGAQDPPKGHEVPKFQTYARTLVNNYQNRLRKEVITAANKDWDKSTEKSSVDPYLFERDWFERVFKKPYRNVDDSQQDLDLKDNALTDSMKAQWRRAYDKFKQELKRREKKRKRDRGDGGQRGSGGSRRRDGAGGGPGSDGAGGSRG